MKNQTDAAAQTPQPNDSSMKDEDRNLNKASVNWRPLIMFLLGVLGGLYFGFAICWEWNR